MKLTTLLTGSLCLVPVVLADTYKITYNTFYDNADTSLNDTACSNGANGLITRGYTTLGSLPIFPYIGGSFAVPHWNSTGCGTCWHLSYNGISIDVTAVDTAGVGFDISLDAFNFFTQGQGEAAGFVFANATQVDASLCGL
ncbi:hypothetical protein POSPLADRAFT_1173041 [Postia placenta MAD-698-R-SB12]|uniref:Cerato-platanin n=1 Tax=Postia placenta MAD-698-R-SB12 TaxID=670580 RepID=A0A1X6MRD2_9APHY|nr:hypothetical protein POSPLADRAFT_1173041 [Postia placenta MAD-698-R-SB12]OSX58786.1 hypothetical protein POSPLADRAFT_1173041 [Postia placenta MAD-698-R-SB12]